MFIASQWCQASICTRLFYQLEGEEQKAWQNRSSQAHMPPATSPSRYKNINLCPWHTGASRKSWITHEYASKWRVKSYSHLGRRAHLKIQKQCTKGLKICLQFSMCSAGLSFLRHITRQSGQAKQAFFCCFYGIYLYPFRWPENRIYGDKRDYLELHCHCKHIFSAGPK